MTRGGFTVCKNHFSRFSSCATNRRGARRKTRANLALTRRQRAAGALGQRSPFSAVCSFVCSLALVGDRSYPPPQVASDETLARRLRLRLRAGAVAMVMAMLMLMLMLIVVCWLLAVFTVVVLAVSALFAAGRSGVQAAGEAALQLGLVQPVADEHERARTLLALAPRAVELG